MSGANLHPPTEPSNADIMAKLNQISLRLDRGDRRFTAIDKKFAALDRISADAKVLAEVAQGYRLASLGGKVLIWLASVLAAIGVIWFVFTHGRFPDP